MKKVYYYIIAAFAVIGVTIGGMWIGVSNGEISNREDVKKAAGTIHASLSGRFEKIDVFIDAIIDANAAVLSFLDTINDARTAFATAISTNNEAAIKEQADIIDTNFINLVALMEDNPASYQTVNLYAGYMGEFAASTNAVTYAINEYNDVVAVYNTHIAIFPNVMFLRSKTPFATWNPPNYATTLPTFN